MSKNRMSIVSGAALVAVALGASLLLTACKASSPVTGGTSGTTTTTATSSVVASGVVTSLGETGTGTLSATATAGTKKPGKKDKNAPPSGTLRPFESLPDPKIPAQSPNAPIAAGKTLPPLKGAPEPTISALKIGTLPNGSQYTITMRPYGIGPDMLLGSRVVIRVDAVKPIAKSPAFAPIKDANLLALANTSDGGSVTKGGTYTATLTFRSDGEKLLPILSQVKAAN